ncbi:helix-turn-helix domain-containing protein [Allocoleopsis sp.]|uniref:helix-turn-helix domain-containing protein n=1 Tax=Allocoleopsis sp. TaxID=3088169 RepID=UPI002FCFDB0E
MSGVFKINITQTAQQLKTLLGKQTTARGKERILALYLLKINKTQTLKDLAVVLGRDTATLYRWLHQYKSDGLEGMLVIRKGQGRKPAIPQAVMEQLRQQLENSDQFKSYGAVKNWLKEEYGIDASYKVVHEAVRYKLNIKLRSSKPRNGQRTRQLKAKE